MNIRNETSAVIAVVVVLALGCAPGSVCSPDASAPLYRIELDDTRDCASRSMAIPARENLACGDLDEEIRGVRVELAGRPGARWTFRLQRTDGAPAATCAGLLDETCGCAMSACAESSFEQVLLLDLGVVDRETVEVMVGAGTYVGELCSL